MACETITDLLVQEAGRFGPEIYDRIFATAPWIGLTKRGAFPDEMGDTISVLTYERSAPTTTTDWDAWTVTGGFSDSWSGGSYGGGTAEGGTCLPTPVDVTFGSTVRTFALKRRVLEGPDFCVTDLRFKFQLRQQLEKILGALAGYSQIEWENRYRRDYSALSGKKMICDATWNTTGYTATGAYAAGHTPTSILTQGMLNFAKNKLIRDGAFLSALGKESGHGVLTLVCSSETSDDLIFRNDDIRQDIRWGRPSDLLSAYGVERSYRGFYHLIDPYPRRWNTGPFTAANEIAAFANASPAKTIGTAQDINPTWETAQYEESHIFDPEVYHSLIPAPITNPAPNFRFDPVTYLGDWRLRNILSRDCNPDGTIVYHRGQLAHAPMPIHPERGFSFIHRRCDPAGALVTSCS